jgi:spore coat polysaccharide biosynthesis protein SpsF (cytidylyltransferase family)
MDVIPWEILLCEEDRVKVLEDNKLIDYDIEMRLTLDYYEDFILIKMLHKKFGSLVQRKVVEDYLANNLDLLKINIFRNVEFKIRQNNQKSMFKDNYYG